MKANAWLNGFLGVLIFSGSLPATKIGIAGFSAEFLTSARGSISGLLALLILLLFKSKIPQQRHWRYIFLVALGVVVGFPLFTAFALQYINASQSVIFIGLMPISTAIFAVFLGEKMPQWPFWLFSIMGGLCVFLYMATLSVSSAGLSSDESMVGYICMIIAVLLCGLGYAAGGQLSKSMQSWQVIAWALVAVLPWMLVATYYYYPANFDTVHDTEILALAYVSLFSMFIGFIFWYRGLAQGGVAKVGQLQLLQPFLALILSALLLKEQVDLSMVLICFMVIGCVWASKKYS